MEIKPLCGTNNLEAKIDASYYDELSRRIKKEISIDDKTKLSHSYIYLDDDEITGYVKKEVVSQIEFEYEYTNGRVTKIKENGNIKKEYGYNNLGYLTYEKNYDETGSPSYFYTYDVYGNCTNIQKIVGGTTIPTNYVYNSGVYYDQLLSCDGISFSWEGFNMKSYNGYSYTYKGNKLVGVAKNGVSTSYTYGINGNRIKKVHNGEETNYYYEGNNLIVEEVGTTKKIFGYDENQELSSITIKEGTNESRYYYLKDILGNVIGLINENGEVVVRYSYRAYGRTISITGTLASTVGNLNPFRYKGYYYDNETKLYFVSSRYYCPELCRWISPDSIEYLDPESINGLNLYAYCGNDPVNRFDPTGHIAISLIVGLVVSFAIGTTASAIS